MANVINVSGNTYRLPARARTGITPAEHVGGGEVRVQFVAGSWGAVAVDPSGSSASALFAARTR